MPDELSEAAEGHGLVDLSGLSLRDLDKFGESSLAVELRRAFAADSEPDVIAGFDNGGG
jgi:hypothetical protein